MTCTIISYNIDCWRILLEDPALQGRDSIIVAHFFRIPNQRVTSQDLSLPDSIRKHITRGTRRVWKKRGAGDGGEGKRVHVPIY